MFPNVEAGLEYRLWIAIEETGPAAARTTGFGKDFDPTGVASIHTATADFFGNRARYLDSS